MNESPIYTIVHNNQGYDKNLLWAGGKNVFVAASSDTKVPYDVWSLSDAGQRDGILTELAEGSVTITVGVYNGTEYIETRMVPYQTTVKAAEPAVVPEVKAASVMADLAEEDKSFNIVAKTGTTESNKEYYSVKSEPATAAVEKMEGDSSEKGDDIKSEPVETAEVAGETPEQKFDALCAAKRWSEALAVLKEVYGDKVSFQARALMTTKTWAATVEKYKLEG